VLAVQQVEQAAELAGLLGGQPGAQFRIGLGHSVIEPLQQDASWPGQPDQRGPPVTGHGLARHQPVALQPVQLAGERGRLDPQHRGQLALDHRPVPGEHAERHVGGKGRPGGGEPVVEELAGVAGGHGEPPPQAVQPGPGRRLRLAQLRCRHRRHLTTLPKTEDY
jgi:hypothetical protein